MALNTSQITLANSGGTTVPANFTPGSYGSVNLPGGPNTVTVDVSGTWSQTGGLLALFAPTQGPSTGTVVVRTIPQSSFRSKTAGTFNGLVSGCNDSFDLGINGAGTLYIIAGSGALTGTPLVSLSSGVGDPSNTGADAGTSVNATIVSRKGTADSNNSITTGGVSQTLFGGVAPSNGYEIINNDSSNVLWVNDQGGAASVNGANCYELFYLGGDYSTPTGMAPPGIVSVIGALTGQKFTARAF